MNKRYKESCGKGKKSYQNKSTFVYIELELVLASFMELPKYTYYIRITQLILFYYVESLQTLGFQDTIWQSTWQSFYLSLVNSGKSVKLSQLS